VIGTAIPREANTLAGRTAAVRKACEARMKPRDSEKYIRAVRDIVDTPGVFIFVKDMILRAKKIVVAHMLPCTHVAGGMHGPRM
jgi:hypothetical protein